MLKDFHLLSKRISEGQYLAPTRCSAFENKKFWYAKVLGKFEENSLAFKSSRVFNERSSFLRFYWYEDPLSVL